MDENPNKITVNIGNSVPSTPNKPIQVMDVRPPASPSPVAVADSTNSAEEDATLSTPSQADEPSINISDPYTPPSKPSPSDEPSTHNNNQDDHKHKTPTQQPKLTADKLIKILVIIVVALGLIASVLYLYVKNQ